jgi:hypothetical protein
MDFCQAGARQGGDKAEAGGGGEGLVRIILYYMTGWGTSQKGDINPVTNTIKMDFGQAGERQGGDEAEAGGGGEGLEGIMSYRLTRLCGRQKGDINPVTTP